MQHYAYSSFGKLLKISDASGNDVTAAPLVKTSYGFTNRELDEESGMMYYRARYYIPALGRFLTEDPIIGMSSSPLTFTSKYIMALNNPQTYTDPNGKFPWLAILVISLAQSAINASFQDGNFFTNLEKEFRLFGRGDEGGFYKSFAINTAMVAIGFSDPGFNLETFRTLGFNALNGHLDRQERQYGSDHQILPGFSVHNAKSAIGLGTVAAGAYMGYNNYDDYSANLEINRIHLETWWLLDVELEYF